MDDKPIEDLIRELVLQRRSDKTARAEPAGWPAALSAFEEVVNCSRDAVMQATVRDIGHLETAWGALKGIDDALARCKAAEAAERNWSECAEVALARLRKAEDSIECLEKALRGRLPQFSPNPKREYVISLLLGGLDRAVRAFERGKSDGLHPDGLRMKTFPGSYAGDLAETRGESISKPFSRAA
jgi:hypothetical protein